MLTPNQSFMRILVVETLYRRSAGQELGDGTPIEQAPYPNLRVGIPIHRDVPSGWTLAVVRAVAVPAILVQGVRNTQPTFDRVELKASEWLKIDRSSMYIVGYYYISLGDIQQSSLKNRSLYYSPVNFSIFLLILYLSKYQLIAKEKTLLSILGSW